jgi:hypothetical protein
MEDLTAGPLTRHLLKTFWVMESLRLDLGYASWVHP